MIHCDYGQQHKKPYKNINLIIDLNFVLALSKKRLILFWKLYIIEEIYLVIT